MENFIDEIAEVLDTNDEEVLEKLLLKSENEIVRKIALSRVTKQETFEKVLFKDKSEEIRCEAVELIKDVEVLKKALNTEKSQKVRNAIMNKIFSK